MSIKKKLLALTFLSVVLLLSGGVFFTAAVPLGNAAMEGDCDRDRVRICDDPINDDCDQDRDRNRVSDRDCDCDCNCNCDCEHPEDCECKCYRHSYGEGGIGTRWQYKWRYQWEFFPDPE
ncbi:MAG: hypothetical protein ACXABU_06890 [Candidatus Hodarchaeales archaeon]